jgi:hypothetical protein
MRVANLRFSGDFSAAAFPVTLRQINRPAADAAVARKILRWMRPSFRF